jgi:ppGpp synthetase/RelA/SpoT-type nucleotidyltranferase
VAHNPEKLLLREWGFRSRKDYEKFIGRQLGDIDLPAQDLKLSFDKAVEHWAGECLAGQGDRFVARVESPPHSRDGVGGSTLLKRPARIAEKVLKSWLDHGERKKASSEKNTPTPSKRHHPQKFLLTVPDIVRFRIVCNYLKDLRFVDKRLQTFIENDSRLHAESREDHIAVHYPGSRVGHRAVEYTVRFKGMGVQFLFEVQIMTQLQHAWDKKDHHLIYEYVRAGKGDRIPVHLKNRMTAMSELLYMADIVFDELLEEITEIMKEGPHD